MMRLRPVALATALFAGCVLGSIAQAQTATESTAVATAPSNSSLDAELFYELLLGELNVHSAEPAAGFALILDAARKTGDPALYQRAVELAFQARSGDAALQAARAWKQAFPQSLEANRYVLQILVLLNRLPETAEPLRAAIQLTEAGERNAVITSVPRLYARVADRKGAASVAE